MNSAAESEERQVCLGHVQQLHQYYAFALDVLMFALNPGTHYDSPMRCSGISVSLVTECRGCELDG